MTASRPAAANAAFFILRQIGRLPRRARVAVGGAVGVVAYFLWGGRRKIVLRNLALAFPKMTATRRRQIARAHFCRVARSVLDRFFLLAADGGDIGRLTRLEGMEHWRAIAGKPAIILAPHFVGMEMGGVRLSREFAMGAFYRAQKSRFWDRALLAMRRRHAAYPLRLFSHREPLIAVCRYLRGGGALYYLPDINARRRRGTVFVPFLGVPDAATTGALGRLARLGGARIIPCVTTMEDDGRYRVKFYPAWEAPADAEECARRMNRFIGERVVESPAQYYWLHRRFKTRPPRAAPLY